MKPRGIRRDAELRRRSALVGVIIASSCVAASFTAVRASGTAGRARDTRVHRYVYLHEFDSLAASVAKRVAFIDNANTWDESCQRDSATTAYCRYNLYGLNGDDTATCSTVLFERLKGRYIRSRYFSGDC
jgi:hypothetical protein